MISVRAGETSASRHRTPNDPTRDLGVTYTIDPSTPGPGIWNCDLEEARRDSSMVVHVNCMRRGRAVLMKWVWRGVWVD